MIYVLPLRTLVEAVYEEAQALAEPRDFKVRMQTGERADAEFFHDADIIDYNLRSTVKRVTL